MPHGSIGNIHVDGGNGVPIEMEIKCIYKLFAYTVMVVMVVMVVALSSLARILGEVLNIDFPPALFFFFKWRSACVH